jgi:hypothetical protein
MQKEVSELIGRSFEYKSNLYLCRNAKVISGMAVVITDRQTFNFYKSEFFDFLEEIVFKASNELKSNSSAIVSEANKNEAVVKKQRENEVITASVIKNFSINEQITDKLMNVFNQLDDDPSDEVIKKASAMVMASNAIVSVQASQFKLLNIKR